MTFRTVCSVNLKIGFAYPSYDARVALELVDEKVKLTVEFSLLVGIGLNLAGTAISCTPVLLRPKRGHILDN